MVFLRILEFMKLDFLSSISASCVDERLGVYSNHLLVTSLVPVVLAALIGVTYLLRLAYIGRRVAEPERAAAREEATQQHASAFLLLSCEWAGG